MENNKNLFTSNSRNSHMTDFLKNLLLFTSPLMVYLIIAISIDPFNIIHPESNKRLKELESNISYRLNYPLYKLQEFDQKPTDLILLGDSRANKISSSLIDSLSKKSSTNLSYGGGTLPEVIDTFWYVANKHEIKEVYIGINFNLYNSFNNNNRVQEAINLKESKLSYLFSNYCFNALKLILKSIILDQTIEIEKPNYTKSEFWNYQLERAGPIYYSNYEYPESYKKSLKDISDYCKKRNIKLILFIPPTHIDLQEKIRTYNKIEELEVFKSDLREIATLYDFNYPNELTKNSNNFSDPYHFNDNIARIVAKEIIEGKNTFSKR